MYKRRPTSPVVLRQLYITTHALVLLILLGYHLDSWLLWSVLPSQSAVLAALLNISIPLELGRLVNAVAQLSPGEEVWDSLQQLVPAGLRLGGLYLTQVSV